MSALEGSSTADAALGGKERRERSRSKGRKEGKAKEKDKEKTKDRDRHKEKKSKDKDKEKDKDRDREHEKEKHKEKDRDKDRDKGRDKDKADKADKDRSRREYTSSDVRGSSDRERDRGGGGAARTVPGGSSRKPDLNDGSRRMMREAVARAEERGEKLDRRDKRRRRSSSRASDSSRGRRDRQRDGGEVKDVAKESPEAAKDDVEASLQQQPPPPSADSPTLPPFAPGTPEAERLAAARAEISRLAAAGQPPPQWLATQVAYGIQAQAQAEAQMRVQEQAKVKAARQESLDKAKKVAKPPPWAAVAAIFQKGKTPSSSSTATGKADGAEAAGAVEGTRVREKPSLAMLSELQKSIAEERNKLRLFVIKAKQDFEERKERAFAAGQRIGVTDEEEYYTASAGEQFGPERCYKCEGPIGRGVFSSVFKCKGQDGKEYAVKFIRSNSMMRRAAEKEVEMYKRLATQARKDDPEGARYLINLSGCQTFEHMGHLCFVFDLLRCDMRAALLKYGQGGGLPIVTLAQYLRQIFLALRALRKIQVIHTDLKPDNILMTMNKAEVQICDFGSAFEVSEQVCTSYCQPRYYRAPEIMLGLRYDTQVDVWSMGTTIFELATGKILFTGKTNNQMLRQFVEVCGRFPQRMMHEGEFSKKHFKANGDFLNKDPDSLTGMVDTWAIHKQAAERPVLGLLQAQLTTPGTGVDKATHDRWVVQLAELVSRCLTPDMDKRLLPEEALELAFFRKER